jgi:small-conductance mechanosensitive channel
MWRLALGVLVCCAGAVVAAHPAYAQDQISAFDELLGRPKQAEPVAADTAAETAAAKPGPDQLQARRSAIAERLSVAQRALESAESSAPADSLAGEVERLKRQKVLIGQRQVAATGNGELEARKANLEAELAAFAAAGLGEPPPYSFFLLDELRDANHTLRQRAEHIETAIRGATDALGDAKTAADEAHRKRRQVAEARERKQPDGSLKLAELDAQIADDQVELRKTELAGQRLNQEVIGLAIELVEKKIELVAPHVTLSEDERREKLVELDQEEADLEFAYSQAEQRLGYLSERVDEAESAAQLAAAPDARQATELQGRRAARTAQQQYFNILNKQLNRLADRREAWSRRFAVQGNTATRAQMTDWASEASDAVEQLAREHRLQIREISDARKHLADLETRLQSVGPDDAELQRSLAEERRVGQELIDRYGENLTTIELARRLQERLLADIREDRMTFAQRLSLAWDYVRYVWDYEVVVSEDQPITVSMVVWGIVLLIAGLIFSRWASAALGGRFLPRLGVHESAATALQTISFYALVSLTALVALRWVNVPLTLFTFLGGAMAIGVGFGSQNLVNNFISGLILLAERPIRAGDVIEVDGLVGSVDTIGARSTRIRTATNYEIIVPNSSLLEKNVINWTLSDKRVRSSISVGMAYGSPTREVARWLKKAAEEHGQVLERPEPFVWFVDFGDNALQFELHYWIQIRAMSERRRIESDLRFIIDQYFREAGLVIAYPQRDLHLSSQQPLKVSLLPADEGEAEAEIAKAA